jgi:hypothetical protein
VPLVNQVPLDHLEFPVKPDDLAKWAKRVLLEPWAQEARLAHLDLVVYQDFPESEDCQVYLACLDSKAKEVLLAHLALKVTRVPKETPELKDPLDQKEGLDLLELMVPQDLKETWVHQGSQDKRALMDCLAGLVYLAHLAPSVNLARMASRVKLDPLERRVSREAKDLWDLKGRQACEDLPERKAGSDPQVIGVNKVNKEFPELREKTDHLAQLALLEALVLKASTALLA